LGDILAGLLGNTTLQRENLQPETVGHKSELSLRRTAWAWARRDGPIVPTHGVPRAFAHLTGSSFIRSPAPP
jgi:hypothetical protein